MLYATLYLRRTSRVVRTVVYCLVLIAYKRSAAFRTSVYESYGFGIIWSFFHCHSDNLRNNLSSLFHVYVVADMKIEAAYEVLVVKCSTLHYGSSQLHGVHVSHRRYGSGATHLIRYAVEAGACTFRLELIGDCPTRRLGCIAQSLLLSDGVDLQYDAVRSNGQILTLRVPIAYIVVNLLQRFGFLHTLRNLESPLSGSLQVLVVTVCRERVAEEIIKVSVELSACHKL